VAISLDSRRSVTVELKIGPADAPIETHKLRVGYRTMTAREQATVRAQYAAMAAKSAASEGDAESLISLSGAQDVALGVARSLVLSIEDAETGEAVTFADGLTWQALSDEARQDASVGLAELLSEVLKLAGGTASVRLLGK
jgi:hypothetical protein